MDRQSAWKKQQYKRKWQSILSVFITIVLLFAIVNGMAKGFSIKDKLSKPSWDGRFAFVVAINSSNPSVFIYNRDPQQIAILTLSREMLFETGNIDKPLSRISEELENSSGKLPQILTKIYGVKIGKFANLSQSTQLDQKSAKEFFVDFASLATPFKLLTAGGYNIEETNITRIDAFRLWWQIKGISVENLKLADLSTHIDEIIDQNGKKVLGADTQSLNRVFSEYAENLNILDENENIKIINNSGSGSAADLAVSFIKSIGGEVTVVENTKDMSETSRIIAGDKNTFTARYLANIFECAINDAQKGDTKGEITLILGSDFASRYFE